MARKVRKRSPTPPLFLFVELLIPWLVMGLVAALAAAAGLSVELIFVLSIGCAVGATFLMRLLENARRRRAAARER